MAASLTVQKDARITPADLLEAGQRSISSKSCCFLLLRGCLKNPWYADHLGLAYRA